ncbi:hypothetical protein [Mycolicibacterium sarraceniae]|nr:hypothetical protein [Mycolicibacterium sarraceniae]
MSIGLRGPQPTNDEANQYDGASTGAPTMSTATIAHSSTKVMVFTRATST